MPRLYYKAESHLSRFALIRGFYLVDVSNTLRKAIGTRMKAYSASSHEGTVTGQPDPCAAAT